MSALAALVLAAGVVAGGGGAGSPDGGTREMGVLIPDGSGLTRGEIVRLAPYASVFVYEGDQVRRDPTRDVVVIYMDRAPDHLRRRNALAVAYYEKRIVAVFVRDLEDYLRTNRGDPVFRIALGRVIAHELEHVRRQTDQHDADGFFKACLSRSR